MREERKGEALEIRIITFILENYDRGDGAQDWQAEKETSLISQASEIPLSWAGSYSNISLALGGGAQSSSRATKWVHPLGRRPISHAYSPSNSSSLCSSTITLLDDPQFY